MVKYQIDPEAPAIVLNVTIRGKTSKKKLEMALDTGATFTMIPWELAEVLGYDPATSKERIAMVTASGVVKVPQITLRSIHLLGQPVRHVKTVVHTLPERSYVDGLLGLSSLRGLKVCLSLKEGYLKIE